jgi:hypothetical protein
LNEIPTVSLKKEESDEFGDADKMSNSQQGREVMAEVGPTLTATHLAPNSWSRGRDKVPFKVLNEMRHFSIGSDTMSALPLYHYRLPLWMT